jgi:hypothetical protein
VGLPLTREERTRAVAGEIGLAYGCSWGSARSRLARAHSYCELPALVAAMSAGEVDTYRAWSLLERTRHLSSGDRAEVTDRMLHRHRSAEGGLTGPHWLRLVGRTVLAVDPTTGEAQARRSRTERGAWHRALDEVTGSIGLTGPLHLTATAWAEIDAAARAAHSAERVAGIPETRTLDQWRFEIARERLLRDGVVAGPAGRSDRDGTGPTDTGADTEGADDLATAGDADSHAPRDDTCGDGDGGAAAAAHDGARSGDVVHCGGRILPVLNVVVPLSTLLGLDDAPGGATGWERSQRPPRASWRRPRRCGDGCSPIPSTGGWSSKM